MSAENIDKNPVEPQEVDLDDFAADFFGQKEEAPSEQASSEDIEDAAEEESDANLDEEDTQSDEVEGEDAEVTTEESDALDDEDEDDSEEVDNDVDQKPKKKNRFQERIDEVIGKQKEAERKLEAALARIEELQKNDEPKPKPVKVETKSEPSPTDLNEDGTEKYPLGEYDPQFVKDLMKHTYEQERAADEARRQQTTQQAEAERHRQSIQAEWETKLGPAQERYPDFQEKGEQFMQSFGNIDEAYGEYLASTLMTMEHGPDVLYYLANNTDEASKIINSGPVKATIALGQIEAKFSEAAEQKKKARPKVSKAPPPPPANKGSAVAVADIPDDTDDLDAFSKKLFAKR